MTIPEFKVKLEKYFNTEMIEDVFRKVPQNTKFAIWGWDVGDFSSDNYPDLAFSIKIIGESKKNTYVYLFVDIDGYLELIYVEPFEYVELPLEIGITINNNKCSITQKKKKDFWAIKSYSFDNGVLFLVEEYVSQQYFGYGLESKINYLANECNIKLESFSKDQTDNNLNYLFVPSYPRNRYVYKGYPIKTKASKVDFVIKGSYYWRGENDASYEIKSSFDQNYLYFTIEILDDIFVSKECEKCIGDKFLLWFDFQPFPNSLKRIFKQAGNQLLVRNKPDGGIFKIEIALGNLLDKQPYIESVNSNEPLDNLQIKAIEKIKLIFTTQEGKYVLKVRLPFSLFGYERVPIENDETVYIGFNAIYVDVDNEFRPDEISYITNSEFDETKPSTFGELILIPDFQKFSFAKNIYVENFLQVLEDFGF
ncbi:MAG: hypothetical protein N2560_06080 [Ignavibacteria bacterium]|nr:hypothetical protein [Ignavibacteria bacterium]